MFLADTLIQCSVVHGLNAVSISLLIQNYLYLKGILCKTVMHCVLGIIEILLAESEEKEKQAKSGLEYFSSARNQDLFNINR